jgi:peptidoglycan/xylan/chitin deacetylase (PgdA/CDA1 family)
VTTGQLFPAFPEPDIRPGRCPALASRRTQRRSLHLFGVAVLIYHRIADDHDGSSQAESPYLVTAAQLREQLTQLRRSGCDVVSLGAVNSAAGELDWTSRAVLTFDDGRASDYDRALPSLMEAHVQAHFFVNTANIGKSGFLNWSQIAEMQRAGMSFQSHGHEHVDLSRLSPADLAEQLTVSRQMLEDRLGWPVRYVAPPYGLVNRQLIETALQVGYRAVCTSRSWPAKPGGPCINRVCVYDRTSLRDFQRLLAGHPAPYVRRAARAACVFVPKQLMLRFRPQQLGVEVLDEEQA